MLQNLKNIRTDLISSFTDEKISCGLLRLDLLHPVVSGNKWFKLRFYLADALLQGKTTIASFGGAYSNHLVAMAHACNTMGLSAVGIVRGEAPDLLSHTLREAISYGMEPVFVPRSNYKNKALLQKELDQPNWYWIEEGGYGLKGAEGAATILDTVDKENYTDIICAVGTGTMMAGLVKSINANQRVTGISVLKNHHSVLTEVNALLNDSDQSKTYSVVPGYHFGGYAKHPYQLIDFMNECWKEQKIPTDIVYTSKLLFAVRDLIKQHYFKPASKLLIIHSGGLQGNYSLPAGKLIF